MTASEWSVGDTGYYVLRANRAAHRERDLYLAFTVLNVTPRRVVVRIGRSHRALKPEGLVKTAPSGAWVRRK